jgi:hypothetical protein
MFERVSIRHRVAVSEAMYEGRLVESFATTARGHKFMTRSERACQIWAVLAWAARNRQTVTYVHLSRLIGVPAAGLGQLLEPVQSYCLTYGLPPLTILVVKQESGLPGSGFTGASASELGKAQMAVFAFDWLEHGNPQPEKLESAVQGHPSNG